jgi:CheY-like chemotaxis protein
MARVLVIDNDIVHLKMVRYILSKAEHDVLAAASGAEGLEMLRHENVDLVILDADMPGMNGVETLEVMREDALTQDVRVIFLTNGGGRQFYDDAQRLDAMAVIGKPFQASKLANVVSKALA